MGVLKSIKQFLQEKDPEVVAEEATKTYIEKKKNGEKYAVEETVNEVIKIIKENYLSESDMRKALTELFERTPELAIKTALGMSKSEEFSNGIITGAVRSSENVSPEAIGILIEEGNMNRNHRIELINQIEDDKATEKHIENELHVLYSSNKERTDKEVIDILEKLKNSLGDIKSENIEKLLEKVIAKQMAENYYSDTMKTTRIYGFSSIIPIEQMIEGNLPGKVKVEFEKLEDKYGPKSGRFNELQLRMQMYNELSKLSSKDKEENSEAQRDKGTEVDTETSEITH